MTRQMPEQEDFEIIIEWASKKIQTHVESRNFSVAAELCELIEAYLIIWESVATNTPASQWLRRRISDTYYFSQNLKTHGNGNDKFSEDGLVGLLKPIRDYVKLNGITSNSMVLSGSGEKIPDGYDDFVEV